MFKKPCSLKQFFLFSIFTAACCLQAQSVSEGLAHGSATSSSGITVQEYTDFLNQVASNDPHHLYDAKMSDGNAKTPLIARLGEPGSYYYQAPVQVQGERMMVMNWLDAVRYCNWKANIQVAAARDENNEITEGGIYELEEDVLIAAPQEALIAFEKESSCFDQQLKSNHLDYCFNKALCTQASLQGGDDGYYSAKNIFLTLLFGASLGGGGAYGYDYLNKRSENVDVLEKRLSSYTQEKLRQALDSPAPEEEIPSSEELPPEFMARELEFEAMYQSAGRASLEIARMAPRGALPTFSTSSGEREILIKEPLALTGFQAIGDHSRLDSIEVHHPLTIGSSGLWKKNHYIQPASFETVKPPAGYNLPEEFMKVLGEHAIHFTEKDEATETGLTPKMIQDTFDRIAAFKRNVDVLRNWLTEKLNQHVYQSENIVSLLDQLKDVPDELISHDHRHSNWTHPALLRQQDFDGFFQCYTEGLQRRAIIEGEEKSSHTESQLLSKHLDPYFAESVKSVADLWASERALEEKKRIDETPIQQGSRKGAKSAFEQEKKLQEVRSEAQKTLATAYSTLASYRRKALGSQVGNHELAIALQEKAIGYLEEASLVSSGGSRFQHLIQGSQNIRNLSITLIKWLLEAAQAQSSHAAEILSNKPTINPLDILFGRRDKDALQENFDEVASFYGKAIDWRIKERGARMKQNHEIADVCASIARHQELLARCKQEALKDAALKEKYRQQFQELNHYLSKQIYCLEEAEQAGGDQVTTKQKLNEAKAWGIVFNEANKAFCDALKAEKESAALPYASLLSRLIKNAFEESQPACWSDLQREQEVLVSYCKEQAEALQQQDMVAVQALNKAIKAQKQLQNYLEMALSADTREQNICNKEASNAYKDIVLEEKKLGALTAELPRGGYPFLVGEKEKALSKLIESQNALIENLQGIVYLIQQGISKAVINELRTDSLVCREMITEAEKLKEIGLEIEAASREELAPYQAALQVVYEFQERLIESIARSTKMEHFPERTILREVKIPIEKAAVAAMKKRAETIKDSLNLGSEGGLEWEDAIAYQGLLLDRYIYLTGISLKDLEKTYRDKEKIILEKYEKLADAFLKKNDLIRGVSAPVDRSSSLGDSYMVVGQSQAALEELAAAKNKVLSLQQEVIAAAESALGDGYEEDLKKPMSEKKLKIALYESLVKTAQRVVELNTKKAETGTINQEEAEEVWKNFYTAAARAQNNLLNSQQEHYDAILNAPALSVLKGCYSFFAPNGELPKPSPREHFYGSFVSAYESLEKELEHVINSLRELDSERTPFDMEEIFSDSEGNPTTLYESKRGLIEAQLALLNKKIAILNRQNEPQTTCFGNWNKAPTYFHLVRDDKGAIVHIEWLNPKDRNEIASLEHLVSRAHILVNDQEAYLASSRDGDSEIISRLSLDVKKASFDIIQRKLQGENTSYWERVALAQEHYLSFVHDYHQKAKNYDEVAGSLNDCLEELKADLIAHQQSSEERMRELRRAGKFNLAERYENEFAERGLALKKEGLLKLLQCDQSLMQAHMEYERSLQHYLRGGHFVRFCQDAAMEADRLAQDPTTTLFQKWKFWISDWMRR